MYLVRVFQVAGLDESGELGPQWYALAVETKAGQMPLDRFEGFGVTVEGNNMDLVLAHQHLEAMVYVRGADTLQRLGLDAGTVHQVDADFLQTLLRKTGRVEGTSNFGAGV